MAIPKYPRRTTAEIQQILSDLAGSGLSQLKFSTQRGIPSSTLQSWLKKDRQAKTSDLPALIPVGSLAPTSSPIEIEMKGGEVIRLNRGFDRTDLQDILEALTQC